MTDEARQLSRRLAVSGLVLLVALVLLRALLLWVVLAVIAWWLWMAVRR